MFDDPFQRPTDAELKRVSKPRARACVGTHNATAAKGTSVGELSIPSVETFNVTG
jgi:hypothetical protein